LLERPHVTLGPRDRAQRLRRRDRGRPRTRTEHRDLADDVSKPLVAELFARARDVRRARLDEEELLVQLDFQEPQRAPG
jgi:hypothetical protein